MVKRSLFAVRALIALGVAFLAGPVMAFGVGPNVNMVTGTQYPEGDPWLTKQNEPSIAVSSRNARTLLGGSNDYRMVNVPVAEGLRGAKAWLHVYKSVDGGTTWYGTPLAGCPDRSIAECGDVTGRNGWFQQLNADFSADPTIRQGPHGTFFYSFIAGVRNDSANGVVAVQRFVDRNNAIQRDTDVRQVPPAGDPLQNLKVKPAEDPIVPDVMWKIDQGTSGQDVDKPWNAADVHRSWNTGQTCELLAWTKGRSDVSDASQIVPAFNVYVSFANFPGSGNNQHPQAQVAVSTDCGTTFGKPVKLSNSVQASQGTSVAIDPLTGHVYVAWRDFGTPAAIYLSKSTDGGSTWSNQPIKVAEFIAYDNDAAGSAFRTLGFPSLAVSVKNGTSLVHVAWTQRRAAPATTPPYACLSSNPADCDARIVIATSSDGGATWPPAVPVDSAFSVAYETNGTTFTHQRGHQVQPALTFAAGKLLVTWIDQRYTHTEEVLRCLSGSCASVNDLTPVREGKGNLDSACSNAILPPPYGPACYNPATVFSTYITDGTPGLVRRHTVDIFAAIADPDTLAFTSRRVSQYAFGSTVDGVINPDGTLTPPADRQALDIRQKAVNAPNLPMFSNGTAAFIGDYIDAAGQNIVATPDADPLRRYKYNVGGTVTGPASQFATGGFAPVFHLAFTDNRDVVPPVNGDWSQVTCLSTTVTPCGGQTGFAGNRNQNVFSSIVADTVAYASSNAKRLSDQVPRGFVVTVENYATTSQSYQLEIVAPSGVTVSFDKASFDPTPTPLVGSVGLIVQPRSSATRSVWVKANSASDTAASIKVRVTGAGFATDVLLNPDPAAPLIGNGDGAFSATNPDLANNDLGNVVLSNAVLTNNVLSNNALSNAVLSNNALSNAVLTNVALTNAVLSNVVLSNAVLSNEPLVNAVLSNVVLSNAVLSNDPLINAVLSNAALTNAMLSNNALSNVALSNVALSNVALSNAVLSNNALSNVALSNNALSNVMLTNAVLSNAALSNVALSNAVLSNAVLTNNALSNVALTNAPLTDSDLKRIEPANPDLAFNPFTSNDLEVSNFGDVTFTVRNRGNTDTTLAIKLILRDATCSGTPPYECTLPGDFKLQLVLRKIGLTPVAIPPTTPATTVIPGVVPQPLALKLGLQQSNAQVSNVGAPVIVDPADPDLGRFIPDKADAATLPLGAGERAQVSLRAIGTSAGLDVINLLRWGVKFVVVDASNNTRTRIPLIIKTLSVPPVTAGQPSTASIDVFGGFGTVSFVEAICADAEGNPASGGACPPSFSLGTFAGGIGTITFTPPITGTFYLRVAVKDASTPEQSDQQLLKVVVNLATPTVAINTSDPRFPVSIPFGASFDLSTLLAPPPLITSSSPAPITFATDPASAAVCTVNGTLLVPVGVGNCTFLVQQGPTSVFAQVSIVVPAPPITVVKANQTITFDTLPDRTLGSAGAVMSFTATATASSGLPVTFTASGNCTVAGSTVTLSIPASWPGSCTVTASQAGNAVYNPAPSVPRTFAILQAGLVVTAVSTSKAFGDPLPAFGVSYSFNDSTCGTRTGTLTFATAATPTSDVGSYAVTPGGVSYQLCAVTFAPGTLTVVKATPVFTNLSAPTIALGTATTAIGGKLAYGSVFPAAPPSVSITVAGTTLSANPQAPDGAFSASFSTGALPNGSYPIAFAYAGNANFNAANATSALVVEGFLPTGAMTQARSWHTATRLVDGRVLVAGGFDASGGSTATSEVYCPAVVANCASADVGKFKAVGNLPSKSAGHTATLLVNGTSTAKVLVAGGGNSSTELFDPGTNTWTASGGMSSTRSWHTATPIVAANGNVVKVLLAGGADNAGKTLDTTLIYDVATGTWTNGPKLATARERHTAVTLADGRVVIAGGRTKSGSSYVTRNSVEIYNPATNAFVTAPAAPAAMSTARHSHAAALVGTKVLVAGGNNGTIDLATSELYDPATNAWTTAGSFSGARREATLTTSPGNELLLAGGQNGSTRLATTNAYDPDPPAAWFTAPAMSTARAGHAATPLVDGTGNVVKVLVTGGIGSNGSATTAAEIFQ